MFVYMYRLSICLEEQFFYTSSACLYSLKYSFAVPRTMPSYPSFRNSNQLFRFGCPLYCRYVIKIGSKTFRKRSKRGLHGKKKTAKFCRVWPSHSIT